MNDKEFEEAFESCRPCIRKAIAECLDEKCKDVEKAIVEIESLLKTEAHKSRKKLVAAELCPHLALRARDAARAWTEGWDNAEFDQRFHSCWSGVRKAMTKIVGADDELLAEVEEKSRFRIWRAYARIQDGNFCGFLYRIAWRVAIDLLARQEKHPAFSCLKGFDPCAPSVSREDSMLYEAIRGVLHEFIPKLSPIERWVLGLRFDWRLKIREVAEILGIPQDTAFGIEVRAKRKLLRHLLKNRIPDL